MRTINVNVMLSARDAYQGGTLQVFAAGLSLQISWGDSIPAHSLSRRVNPDKRLVPSAPCFAKG